MASRLIHYAIAKLVSHQYPIRNFDRFLFGELLPDAYAPGYPRRESHLQITSADGANITYDLTRFRTVFAEKLCSDDLYKGYYLHLIQDICFRSFVYNRHHWSPLPAGNVQRLHHDYSLLNTYVISRYNLENRLTVPEDFACEMLNQLYPFEIPGLLRDFCQDFSAPPQGDYHFFTPRMADEFIQIAADTSTKELRSLELGNGFTDENLAAWGTAP